LALKPAGPARDRPSGVEMSNHRLLAFTAVALLFSVYYASRIGVDTLFTTRAERVDVEGQVFPDKTVLAVVKAAATFPLVVAFSGLLRLRRQRRAVGRRGPLLLPGLVLLVMVLVVSPVSSPRYLFGTAALAVVVALGATATPGRTRWFALLLAASLVLVFPYADSTRRPGATEQRSGPAEALSSSDFDAFDQVNNAVAFVRAEGATQGRQALGAALFWVPRSVWTDKPEDTGVLLADFRDYAFSNLSAPLWAELFINGGWAGLVVGMLALGVVVRWLDQRPAAGPRSIRQRGVLADILPFYLIIMLRGSLLQSMAGFAVLAVSALFVTERSTPASTAPSS
ncbi:MAG: oligosaccharide repeat unit polymerase, partial [Actinomycetota bacterium]|nr:oligosaccharide repeat unit polymerase [Actinomycetota bacterium]